MIAALVFAVVFILVVIGVGVYTIIKILELVEQLSHDVTDLESTVDVIQEAMKTHVDALTELELKPTKKHTECFIYPSPDERLNALRYCIAHGCDEDAQNHIFALLQGLICKHKPDEQLTPEGKKLKAEWFSSRY